MTIRPWRDIPQAVPTRLEDVIGILAPYYKGPPVSVEEMDRSVGEYLAERWRRFEETGTDYKDE